VTPVQIRQNIVRGTLSRYLRIAVRMVLGLGWKNHPRTHSNPSSPSLERLHLHVIPTSNDRFTLDGSPTLERRLAELADETHFGVSEIVPPGQLAGILLSGPYGRGEGAVLKCPEGEVPIGDWECWILVRKPRLSQSPRLARRLQTLADRLSASTGLAVQFFVRSLSQVRRKRPSLDYHDLLLSHRWIVGEPSLLERCEHHRDSTRIPLHEATRRLLNRCTDLLLASEFLNRPVFGPREADRVDRTLTRMRLALGDVLLVATGQFHPGLRERHQRFQAWCQFDPPTTGLPLDRLLQLHALGLESTLRPAAFLPPRDTLAADHAELVQLARETWLWLEQRRLKRAFRSALDYVESGADKCPETAAWRNRLTNFLLFGLKMPLCSKGARHPRERLLHSLALLLWEYPRAHANPALRNRLRWELHANARDLSGWIQAYRRLWPRFA